MLNLNFLVYSLHKYHTRLCYIYPFLLLCRSFTAARRCSWTACWWGWIEIRTNVQTVSR